jgi:hypothetical protein
MPMILSIVHSDNIDNSRNNTVTRTSNKKRKAPHNKWGFYTGNVTMKLKDNIDINADVYKRVQI